MPGSEEFEWNLWSLAPLVSSNKAVSPAINTSLVYHSLLRHVALQCNDRLFHLAVLRRETWIQERSHVVTMVIR
jgi:hypothetical protein